MIQGGDPTGTGKGGTSIWGKKFNDEIRESLKVSSTLGIHVLIYFVLSGSNSLMCWKRSEIE